MSNLTRFIALTNFILLSAIASGQISYSPPTFSPRTMAEWEELDAITISWRGDTIYSILSEIVRHAQEECDVYIVCSDSNAVLAYLNNRGIQNNRISFLQEPFDSPWIRDYGQQTIYENDVDNRSFMDWDYNRQSRIYDDVVPFLIANKLNIPIYSTNLYPSHLTNTGGNFLTDGMGTAMASELVLTENAGMTTSEIDDMMNLFMGIDNYIKLDELTYDNIHHLDMHMRFLDEETLLVGKYPNGIADGPEIEANIDYISQNFTSAFGTPYQFVRIDMPSDNGVYPDNGGKYKTYTNFMMINTTILVPTYGDVNNDSIALNQFEELYPGYNIKGIDCTNIIHLWGAIHCITNAIGVANPLRIVHQRLRDTYTTSTPFEVTATIQHRTGIKDATLKYSTDLSNSYQSAAMSLTDTANNIWTGYIPGQAANTRIHYYIEGKSYSGKKMNRPMPAPAAYWKFDVLPQLISGTSSTSIGEVSVFPNPTNGLTTFSLELTSPQTGEIVLLDAFGRIVKTLYSGDFAQGTLTKAFDIKNLPKGTYIIQFNSADNRINKRISVF